MCQCELGCSTFSPTRDGGIGPPAVAAAEELGGEEPLLPPRDPLRLELPPWPEAEMAGRIRGGGGWLWGARLWRGRVWRGGG